MFDFSVWMATCRISYYRTCRSLSYRSGSDCSLAEWMEGYMILIQVIILDVSIIIRVGDILDRFDSDRLNRNPCYFKMIKEQLMIGCII